MISTLWGGGEEVGYMVIDNNVYIQFTKYWILVAFY